MPITEGQKKAVYGYKKRNYDFFNLRMEKGKRDIIKKHAENANESLNQYILNAIATRLESEKSE